MTETALPRLNILGTILIYVALVLTVVSLIDYIAKNKDVLKDILAYHVCL